jgi:hypothetical protein
MPANYGLEVRSTAGSLQIHRGAANYVFKRKVSTTQLVPDSGSGWGASYRFTPLSPASLLAVRCPFDVNAADRLEEGSVNLTLTAYGGNAAPIDVWEFAPVGATDEHYGMKVWDQWGDLTFNSAESTMKIVSAMNTNFYDSPLHDNYAAPAVTAAGRLLGCVLLGSSPFHPDNNDRFCITTVRLSAGSFLFNRHWSGTNSTPGAQMGDPNIGFLLVDITDHQ